MRKNHKLMMSAILMFVLSLTCFIQSAKSTSPNNINASLFPDDNSELAYTASKALDAYYKCIAIDPLSVASKNNLGVLYILLCELDNAENNLNSAVSQAINKKYGYTGIKINLGVLKSEQGFLDDADDYYTSAFEDTDSFSVLRAQIYFNQAWDNYMDDNLTGAMSQVDEVILNGAVNDFLKAKAYVLRGVIYYYEDNDATKAIADFQLANTLDPEGPIGLLARNNLDAIDTDGDGSPDYIDGCPQNPNKTEPGVCGCGIADTDSDNDQTPDCIDECPNDPDKIEPGVCGCGIADIDSDNDQTPDCIDGCPQNPNKTEPGVCGCGIADTDSDNDQTPDCIDECPNDPDKTEPGDCGCGVKEGTCGGDGGGGGCFISVLK